VQKTIGITCGNFARFPTVHNVVRQLTDLGCKLRFGPQGGKWFQGSHNRGGKVPITLRIGHEKARDISKISLPLEKFTLKYINSVRTLRRHRDMAIQQIQELL
jgi:hypothetical protein